MLRSKRRVIIERVKKATAGVCCALTDLVLEELAVLATVAHDRGAAHSLPRLNRLSRELRESWDERKLLTAIRKLREKGWISRDLVPTVEGQRRLQGFVPEDTMKRRWNGKWYMVTFDIPERERAKRQRLREVLRALGYVPLHQSVWLASEDFFGDLQKFLKEEELTRYVIFSVSQALGTKGSRELAARLWDVDDLNWRYRDWVKSCERRDRPTGSLYWEYIAIRQSDPQLPTELLPRGWYGVEAGEIFAKHFATVSR